MTLRTMPAWLALAAALAASPVMAADMPAGYAGRGGAEADVSVTAPPPRRLLGFGYAPVLPYYGVSVGPYGYPPRREPGIGVGLF